MSSPAVALNHCRFSSTRLTRPIGVPQISAAGSAMWSKSSSGAVSST
jgi:hypothetical protein